ncbi:MAG: dimethyl sulfoxide reductase anchor subunit [Coriobacteriales bacterium]|nr:dimethyl sulfoxide reductase anchor subunit [Coriobacteriales bacterium]
METQWPLVLFTLFLCLSCGLMLFQGIIATLGKGSSKFHQAAIITSAVSLAVGGIAVFFHLKHWERIFNGFGHITSGITHELILVVVMFVAFIAGFIMLRKGRDLGRVMGIVFIVIAVIGGFVTAHSYDMYARPAWNNIFLYLYYYSSLLLLGAAAIWTVASICKEPAELCKTTAWWTLVCALLSLVVVIAAMVFISNITPSTIDGITFYTYDPTHQAVDPSGSLAVGMSSPLFWLGAVVIGCVVPAIVAFLAAKKSEQAAKPALPVVALLCGIAGGVCYRVVLYMVAIASYVYFF